MPYPNGRVVLVIFKLDGDVDEDNSYQLEFSADGSRIYVFARVPEEMKSAGSLLGINNKVKHDADCQLLDTVIKRRLEASQPDEFGDLWVPREIIELPFKCHKCLFNKHNEAITSFLLRKNNKGYGWGYFWVTGEHVSKKVERLSQIQGELRSIQI